MLQKILVVETKTRRVGSKATAYENINFARWENPQFPDSPKQALRRGWRLISPPVYNETEEVYEWWFEKYE